MSNVFTAGALAICPSGPAGGHRDFHAPPCRACVAAAEDILIATWHSLDAGLVAAMPLHEWLGMTWEQYAAWAEGRVQAAAVVTVRPERDR